MQRIASVSRHLESGREATRDATLLFTTASTTCRNHPRHKQDKQNKHSTTDTTQIRIRPGLIGLD